MNTPSSSTNRSTSLLNLSLASKQTCSIRWQFHRSLRMTKTRLKSSGSRLSSCIPRILIPVLIMKCTDGTQRKSLMTSYWNHFKNMFSPTGTKVHQWKVLFKLPWAIDKKALKFWTNSSKRRKRRSSRATLLRTLEENMRGRMASSYNKTLLNTRTITFKTVS